MEEPKDKPDQQFSGIQNELAPDYIISFDDLIPLGSTKFDAGQKVSFQPWGRYDNERQTGTVRLWPNSPHVINITFTGSKAGVSCPDGERITREEFEERKDVWKIRKVE